MNLSELIKAKKDIDRQLAKAKKELTRQLGEEDHILHEGVRVEKLYEQPTFKGMELSDVVTLFNDLKAQGVEPLSVISFNLSVRNIGQVDRRVEETLWQRSTGSSRGVAFKAQTP